MQEGRSASASFDVTSYANAYQDLRLAFGSDLKKYYLHYLNYGQKEGRVATGVTELQNPVTKNSGVNYASVYDYEYYLANNPDVAKRYTGDDVGALQHFITYGMQEGRIASASFDVSVYANAYQDLQQAYGSDLKKYYLHYINYGLAEGRVGV